VNRTGLALASTAAHDPTETLAINFAVTQKATPLAMCWGIVFAVESEDMRRREFISLLGSVSAWPLMAHAQQAIPTIGFIYVGATSSEPTAFVTSFRQGLREAGFVEGDNLAVEYRYAAGQEGKAAALVAELVHRPVAVLVGNTPPAVAAKEATSTIPIVFATGADPVKLGLVASFNRPGGNTTGVSFLSAAIEPKRLGVLHDLLPHATAVAVLVDPSFLTSVDQLRDLQDAARAVGWQAHVLQASTESELDGCFATLDQQRPDALLVSAVPFFESRRNQIIQLAARHSLPTMYPIREFAASGGLVSYGDSISDAFRLAGIYAGRILKGEKPAEMPVLRPTKFELVINMKTAKDLGIVIPPGILAIADEVIE
jgi:putative tryptophan/tyrosine transport system substrate-binding protein